MQKIAILSDIHGNIAALENVAADLQSRQVDCVINLGDHVSGPLWPKETIQFLMKQDWIQIMGNHDRQLVHQPPDQHGLSDRHAFQRLTRAELDWLGTLPARVTIQDQFLAFHGAPTCDTTYLLETVDHGRGRLATREEISSRMGTAAAPVVLCGHTHIPRVVEGANQTLFINPGSVGLPAYDDVLPEYHVMETGSPHARYAILESINGVWRAEIIALAYDHLSAAEQARKNGRPDWAYGLQTGFMQLQG